MWPMLYLLIMALVIYFAPPLLVKWLAKELDIRCEPASYVWRLSALVALVIAIVIHNTFNSIASNFILHALGGGVAASLLYFYVKLSLKINVNWKIDLLVLFAFVSVLGCLNELAEYLLDSLQVSEFSLDRKDTWRDIVANTSGAFVGWLVVKSFIKKS